MLKDLRDREKAAWYQSFMDAEENHAKEVERILETVGTKPI